MDDSQFIIATHSPILMSYPNATIYSLSTDGIRKIDYYETEHYQVTRDFLINPKRMLDVLLEPSSEKPLQPTGRKPARR
jgi:predicted ATPase